MSRTGIWLEVEAESVFALCLGDVLLIAQNG
jgi:hypothetical protein